MKREKKTLRDHANERLQFGIIGALVIVIVAFLTLGNVSVKYSPLASTENIHKLQAEPMDELIIPKPPQAKVNYGEIKEVTDPNKADTSGLTPPEWNAPLPGLGNLPLDLDTLPFPGIDVTFPVLKTPLDIDYPKRLRDLKIEGTVQLLIGLDKEGRVFDVRIFKTSGFDEFDNLAVEAVRSARFSPAEQNGIAIPVKVAFPVNFRLER